MTSRSVRPLAVTFFLGVFLAMMWPVYPLFAGIYPRLLGLPLSLFYQAFLLVLAFVVLLALYRWERRHGEFS